mmetsp:Transcript_50896/g.110416  ORF Transcript_50896/g.110416 Transcript_50896/m.110416 type:complete len:322 (+) Transcript_50896:58-1023(+)|eukprot:CAMPEP_0170598686 /NCGR_PEP_ID=MMETSP0224-20130122/16382_1 /TAXON_ID=285029 /ORGANISM="Togula jolla, Strain CCCM 725" /LENGTH=321 /DNA_ID=CAMNT_0010923259 /DNA_START=53 /DNA_END=1018 /DNA_ORIENTATION=-
MTTGNKWMEEELEPGLRVQYRLQDILHSGKSEFQTVDLVNIEPFGTTLVIDGLIQSTNSDEFVYHECLVHPAMLSHPNPKFVFIGGGGEGGTAREVLRHKSVEKCVMVDIDGDVVKFCREHLPQNKEAFADPRLELIIDDAKVRLEQSPIKFDVIIMDLDDPLEGGPCYQLYTKEFYTTIQSKLNPGGVMVTQSGQAGIKQHPVVFSPINSTLRSVFPRVVPYNQAVYSFMDEWGWNLALTDADAVSPDKMSQSDVDARIAERLTGELRFLDGQSWAGIWALSKVHRQTLAKETVVMSTTGNTHCFMHNPGVKTGGGAQSG